MKREMKRPKNIMVKPSVVKMGLKLQKKMEAESFSDLVEKLILEAAKND